MATTSSRDAIAHVDVEDTVITGEAVELELRPTGFALAAAGAIIDWLVYFVGGLLVFTFVIIPAMVATEPSEDDAVLATVVSVCLVTFLVVIPIVVELLSKGKSLGRLAVGARIVREDGGAVGFRQVFIRQLVALVEIYATLGGLAALFGILNGKSKRAGDFLAGTYSQYERLSRVLEPVFGIPPALETWSLTADVARIPNRLALRVSKFLRQSRQLTPFTRGTIAAQLAREVAVYVSPIPAADPELFVAAVMAMRREREFAAHQLEKTRFESLRPALTALPHDFPDRG